MKNKVLIIDDTKNIRLMLTKCMELEGYTVETADNGKTGLEMATENSYCLIFLDIKLPEISGTEVLRQLRAKGILTPVIVITAYPTVKNAVDCTQLGAINYLQKPFTIDRIHNVLLEMNIDNSKEEAFSFVEIEKEIEKKDYDLALKMLKEALAKHPDNSTVYNLLGAVYKKMGNETLGKKFSQMGEILRR